MEVDISRKSHRSLSFIGELFYSQKTSHHNFIPCCPVGNRCLCSWCAGPHWVNIVDNCFDEQQSTGLDLVVNSLMVIQSNVNEMYLNRCLQRNIQSFSFRRIGYNFVTLLANLIQFMPPKCRIILTVRGDHVY